MGAAKGWRLETTYEATMAESVRVQRNAATAVAESGVVIRSQGAGSEMYLAGTTPERPALSWSLRFTATEEEATSLYEAIIRLFRSECDVDAEVRLRKEGSPPDAS